MEIVLSAAPAISIHSPRMGRDPSSPGRSLQPRNFNPLSPHGERPRRPATPNLRRRFQSTLPAWGETRFCTTCRCIQQISIHSPRMGRDVSMLLMAQGMTISIHSPRMGRDGQSSFQFGRDRHFNPLSPHGERLLIGMSIAGLEPFQSTLPAWGETGFRIDIP